MVALLRHRTEWVGCSIKDSQQKSLGKIIFRYLVFHYKLAILFGAFLQGPAVFCHFTIGISVICTSSGTSVLVDKCRQYCSCIQNTAGCVICVVRQS